MLGLVQLDTAARYARTGIPRRWRLAFQIIGIRMDDDALADDRVWSIEADGFCYPLERGFAGSIGSDVTEVTGVALRILGPAVLGACWVEVTTRRGSVRRRTISFGVNVKSVLALRKTGGFGDDADAAVRFIKIHRPADIAAGSWIEFRPRVSSVPMLIIA